MQVKLESEYTFPDFHYLRLHNKKKPLRIPLNGSREEIFKFLGHVEDYTFVFGFPSRFTIIKDGNGNSNGLTVDCFRTEDPSKNPRISFKLQFGNTTVVNDGADNAATTIFNYFNNT